MKIGLIGYGKAGQAVATVLADEPDFELAWIVRRQGAAMPADAPAPLHAVSPEALAGWLGTHPVDAIVDFSSAEALPYYAAAIEKHGITLISAISAYTPEHLAQLRELGRYARVMASPNITLGINFLMIAARLLRRIAPFADVEVLEQHFKEKPEVSGTARKLAGTLGLDDGNVTALRLGGIVGHHEVIFGFKHQTVRLIHNAIRREAFGTGAAFALRELATQPIGFYAFEQLLQERIRQELLEAA